MIFDNSGYMSRLGGYVSYFTYIVDMSNETYGHL